MTDSGSVLGGSYEPSGFNPEDLTVEEEKELQGFIDCFKPRFESNMQEEVVPRHPYKVYIELVKDQGLYQKSVDRYCKKDFFMLEALDRLKNHYTRKWEELKENY